MTHLSLQFSTSQEILSWFSMKHLLQTNFCPTKDLKPIPLAQTRSPAMLFMATNFLIKCKPHFVFRNTLRNRWPRERYKRRNNKERSDKKSTAGWEQKNLSPLCWFYLSKSFHILGDPTKFCRCHACMPECHTKLPPSFHCWAPRFCCIRPPSNFRTFWRMAACPIKFSCDLEATFLVAQEKSLKNAVVG